MGEKPITVAEMACLGGLARAKAHNRAEIQSQAECAATLGVSVRTIVASARRIG